jgi:hypothetical protein
MCLRAATTCDVPSRTIVVPEHFAAGRDRGGRIARGRRLLAPRLLPSRADRIAPMTDRRRTRRYVLEAPLRGEALPMEDVTIESCSSDRLVVVSPSAHRPDEELMVHLTMPHGLESRRAAVVSSTPVSVADTLCYRVELRLYDLVERRADSPREGRGLRSR